jgi:hypothetical protein
LLPERTSARYVGMRAWIGLAAIAIMAISCTQTVASAGLVRGGATSLLIQQYGGLNDQPPLGLLASIQVRDSTQISQLVHELNTLPAYPSGTMHCPMDDGSYFALAFSFGDGTSTMVKVEARGCQGVYVGGSKQPVAWPATSPALLETLRGLVAPQPAS